MTAPLADAKVGERYRGTHPHGGERVVTVLMFEGEPWVGIDFSLLGKAAEWPGWDGWEWTLDE